MDATTRNRTRQRRNKQKTVIDPDFGPASFPPLPPKTAFFTNSPWGTLLGRPKTNFLEHRTRMLMPQDEQIRYRAAFAANQADRKAYREALKLERYEKLRKENQLRRALASKQGRRIESHFAGKDKVFDNTVSILASSVLAFAAKFEFNNPDNDPAKKDDCVDLDESTEKFLARFRHGETDLHLRALLWQREQEAILAKETLELSQVEDLLSTEREEVATTSKDDYMLEREDLENPYILTDSEHDYISEKKKPEKLYITTTWEQEDIPPVEKIKYLSATETYELDYGSPTERVPYTIPSPTWRTFCFGASEIPQDEVDCVSSVDELEQKVVEASKRLINGKAERSKNIIRSHNTIPYLLQAQHLPTPQHPPSFDNQISSPASPHQSSIRG
ncbi:hypothetical protein GLAREA_10508 [Glarea lozoyensis ATCC 20868]|uniref:Uncharacterized protein n=1 Tax=Glarea lozoyensis (strain ATCC 20868 / MF5171) TaxID=1116229 RepID=S3E974_GLAL2|nr:uncharacterized protein GLAREA_10508 [Glarea lozoyensis ATCC 20868]EPE34813.1 hypothetical protein GLAREA_10508 [Glarea lozoyensis ATCC 20868]